MQVDNPSVWLWLAASALGVVAFAVIAGLVIGLWRHAAGLQRRGLDRISEALFGPGEYRRQPEAVVLGFEVGQMVVGRHRVGEVRILDKNASRGGTYTLVAISTAGAAGLTIIPRRFLASPRFARTATQSLETGRRDLDAGFRLSAEEPARARAALEQVEGQRALELLLELEGFSELADGTTPSPLSNQHQIGLESCLAICLVGSVDRQVVEDLERAVEALHLLREAFARGGRA